VFAYEDLLRFLFAIVKPEFPWKTIAIASILLVVTGKSTFATKTRDSIGSHKEFTVPTTLYDIDKNIVDVDQLARRRRLVFVTLKSPSCPVCFSQLLRLHRRRLLWEKCGVTFIVLSPGLQKAIIDVRRRTQFSGIFVEDVDLKLARSLELDIDGSYLKPTIFRVDKLRRISWIQHGRSARYFGDRELLQYLQCKDVQNASRP
tara:strand:- start:206 stop:814 length:609 start_codon:yes stop_codon:yes gene_type:complete